MLCGLVLGGCSFPHGALDRSPDAPPDSRADSDNDGVADQFDNCPMLANTDQLDHDTDGHGDGCDHCPHLANATDPDGDGDGVGDDCDPRPAASGDHIALWEGFYAVNVINGWTKSGAWSVSNGEVHQPSSAGETYLQAPAMYAHPYVAVGAKVDGLGGAAAQLGICTSISVGQYYCCIAKSMGPTVSGTSSGNVTNFNDSPFTGTFAMSSQFTIVENEVGTHNCSISQGTLGASAPTTLGTTNGIVELYTQAAAASYDYVFIVEIGP